MDLLFARQYYKVSKTNKTIAQMFKEYNQIAKEVITP